MALINEHFLKLQNNYLFSDIAKKVNSFKVTHPKDKIIRMGIGDVTQPLAPAVIEAMHKAVEEMASKDTFHGYGPEQGYPFLIDAIIKNDYASRGVFIEPSEVFISDGAKSDCGNIGDMLRHDNSIGDRPRISGLHRLERNERTHRGIGKREMERCRIHPLHGGKQLRTGSAQSQGGHPLPLLSQ